MWFLFLFLSESSYLKRTELIIQYMEFLNFLK